MKRKTVGRILIPSHIRVDLTHWKQTIGGLLIPKWCNQKRFSSIFPFVFLNFFGFFVPYGEKNAVRLPVP
jgi:hypothetical protein